MHKEDCSWTAEGTAITSHAENDDPLFFLLLCAFFIYALTVTPSLPEIPGYNVLFLTGRQLQ